MASAPIIDGELIEEIENGPIFDEEFLEKVILFIFFFSAISLLLKFFNSRTYNSRLFYYSIIFYCWFAKQLEYFF